MKDNFESLNNKVNVLIFLVVVSLILNIIILGGGTSSNNTDAYSNTDTENSSTTTPDSGTSSDYDVSDFSEIEAKDISKFKKGTINVVYIGRETCSWCKNMLPNLKQAQKDYKYTTKYIDIAKIIDFNANKIIDQSAYDILVNLDTEKSEADVMKEFGSTPMMLIIKNNKIIASQVGYSDYDTFAKVLEKGGLKK